MTIKYNLIKWGIYAISNSYKLKYAKWFFVSKNAQLINLTVQHW